MVLSSPAVEKAFGIMWFCCSVLSVQPNKNALPFLDPRLFSRTLISSCKGVAIDATAALYLPFRKGELMESEDSS